jgi:hypothetical protein
MTRIAHISDIHWRGIARHSEYTKAFQKLFDELKELKPDIIINTGDSFHTKTQGITPEIIEKLAWMFRSLAEIAPTYNILGNHDGNLTNSSRQDIVTPIHDIVNHPDSFLLKKSQTVFFKNLAIHAFSAFDKENWDKLKPVENYINIALFHGSITGCMTDNEWRLQGCEENVDFFKDFDFCLLGDIHKHQYLAFRKDKNDIQKPWIGYPGSLIQQNFGESVEKGYLIWDIRDKDDWDVTWKKLINMAPFVTVPWLGSVQDTIKGIENNFGNFAFLPGTRYRISSSVTIPQIQSTLLIKELKESYKASEVVFKSEFISKMDSIKTNGLKISKKGLSNDPETIMKLYKEYIDAHKENYATLTNEDYQEVSTIIRNYLTKLHTKNSEFDQARNVTWTLKDFQFNNLFGYGENNTINFENFENIVGVFGSNRIGKSSIIGGIMYTLFNTTDRGPLKNAHIINRNKNECYGKLRFSVSGVDYIVERKTIRKKNSFDDSSTTVNFWEVRNDNGQEVKVSRNGDTGPDTDALIRKTVGTAEDFMLTALANQFGLNKFIENKATKRKEILNRFLELDVFDYLFDYAKTDYSVLNNQSQKFSIKDLVKSIEKTSNELQKLEDEVAANQNKINTLNNKRDELNVWIKSHENVAAAVEISAFDNLKKHIDSCEHEINTLQNNLKTSKEKLKETETNYRLLNKKLSKINLDKLAEDQKLMQEMDKSVSELRKTFELQNEKLSTDRKAIIKLNVVPCGDTFPNCHFIRDGHEAKKTIADQKKLVEKLEKDLEGSKKLLEKYAAAQISETIKEHNSLSMKKVMAESDIQRLSDKIKHDEEKLEIVKRDLRTSKAKLSTSKKSMDKLESEEFKKKKLAIQKVQDELSEIAKIKNENLLKMGAKKQLLEKALNEQEEKKDLVTRLKMFESIQSAFSKNGIPAMILKSQLPAINRELAKILDSLIDFNVTLETDTTSNIMDVCLSDGKSKRLIEMCSGMEKTICSIALRVALSNLSSLPKSDMLILDESFSALDEENLQKGIEFLSVLRGYFKFIFVITHETPIKEVADRVLEIKSDGTESRIEA